MKKMFMGAIIIVVVGMLSGVIGEAKSISIGPDKLQNDISDKIIRFHVLANSDSDEDQNLKLKVKDEVLKYMKPILDNSKSITETRKLLLANDDKIKEIANKVIKQNGYNYSVNTELSNENFPIKTYGNITLPAGEYKAYRILIGNAKGRNWWCVMFPPLCFIDITKGEVSEDQSVQDMKKVLSDEEVDYIRNDKKIEYRFKIVDAINKVLH